MSESQTSAPAAACATCLGTGEIGTDHGMESCPDCFGEGRRLALAERAEWRMRDIERGHRGDAHGCAGDMRWLIFELRRSRDALQRILARCHDEEGNQLATDVKFVANQVLELYEAKR